MSHKVQYRGTIGAGIIGQLLHMPVGPRIMDLSLKRDSPLKVTPSKEMNPENTSTPLTVNVNTDPEPSRRKQKHPQSLRATHNSSPSLVPVTYATDKSGSDKMDSDSATKKRKLESTDFVHSLYNGGDLIYDDVNQNITKESSDTLRQQFSAFKRLSSQRWESLRKENTALKQEVSLLKNVLIAYFKSHSSERDAQDAVEALQNAYYVPDDTTGNEKSLMVDSTEKDLGVSNGIKEQLKAALTEKQAKSDMESEKYKSVCDSLQKQVKLLQAQCEKLRSRMLPALGNETRSFLQWVLMTSEENDELFDATSLAYYQSLPRMVDSENNWRQVNGNTDSWRATPTEPWKEAVVDRPSSALQAVDEQHLTPVSAQGAGPMEDTELWPGTGVYVNSADLAGYVENSHKNPAVLFHSLVKHFFTLDQLSRSVPYGPHNNKKCDKEILPENIVKAIEGYVLCCASQPGWKSWTQHQLRKAFSNKCTGARRNHIRPDGTEYGDDSDMSMMEWNTGSPSLVKKESTPPIVVNPLS